MTTNEKAREIVLFIRELNDEQAIQYVRSHLEDARGRGFQSGIEQARQVINAIGQNHAA